MHGVYKTFNAGTPDEVRALARSRPERRARELRGRDRHQWLGQEHDAQCGRRVVSQVDAGTIRVAGREISGWPEHRRAKLIGRVFQDPLAGTSPTLSIAENLALAAGGVLPRGLGRAVSGRHTAELRDRVRPLGMGLEDRLDNPIGSLSGGQRQALTLLMATYRRPSSCCSTSTPPRSTRRSAEQVIRLTEQIVRPAASHDLDGHALDGPCRLAGRPPGHGSPGPRHLRRRRSRQTSAAAK